MKSKILTFICFFCVVTSCKKAPTVASTEEYLKEYNEKTPSVTLRSDGIEYLVQLITPELLRIRNNNLSDSLARGYENRLCFQMLLKQEKNGEDILNAFPSNTEEFTSILNYLSTGMQNDLWLIAGTDSIPCEHTLLEPTYGIRKNDPIIFGFKLPGNFREYDHLTLTFQNHLSDGDLLRFEFNEHEYKYLPYLKIK